MITRHPADIVRASGLPSSCWRPGRSHYLAAKAVKSLVERGRPGDLLTEVALHGSPAHGLGYPSGHAAVSMALTASAFPFLVGRSRWAVWLVPATVGFARVYVGAHFPLDVIGGFALGYTLAALTHLVGGSPE